MVAEQVGRVKPGEHLRAEIERRGLDQASVADATGVSRQTINNIVNNRQAISRAMAAKLGRLMGLSSDYWLRSDFTPEPASPRTNDFEDDKPDLADAEPGPVPFALGVLVDHQIARAVRDKVVGIDPFNEDNIRAASVDLTLDDFVVTVDGDEIDISGEPPFLLKAGQMVNVRTKEWVVFPHDYLGRVGAMTQLTKFGIIVSHGFQVDPGYSGQLQFCLFNAGPRSFELRSGMPIISLEIVHLSSSPTSLISLNADSSPSIAPEDKKPTDRSDVKNYLKKATPERVIREAIRTKVTTVAVGDMHVGRISELDTERVDSSSSDAADAVIAGALEMLKTVRAYADKDLDETERYNHFFKALAETIFFDRDQVRKAVEILRPQAFNDGAIIFELRGGRGRTAIHPPHNSSKIAFKALARQLREDPQDLILMLMGLLPYG